MARKKSNLLELLRKAKNDEEIPYTDEEIYQAISEQRQSDIDKLVMLYGDNYTDILDVMDGKITVYIATTIIPRIKKTLSTNRKFKLQPKGEAPYKDMISIKTYTNTREIHTPNEQLDPLDTISKILSTKSMSEIEDTLTKEEAILLVLRLGASNLGMFGIDALSKIFNMDPIEVQEILMSATDKYLKQMDTLTNPKGFQKKKV